VSKSKPPRPIAGDVGTADRIEADDGHYWVRLATAGAIRAEGFVMRNCLTQGFYVRCALSEGPLENGLWSLRTRTGASVALAEFAAEWDEMRLIQFLGPINAMASALAYRQLLYLAGFFSSEGRSLAISNKLAEPVVVAEGKTYRWDRAPRAHRLADHKARMTARREVGVRRAAHRRHIASGIPAPTGAPPSRLIELLADCMEAAAEAGLWTPDEIGDLTLEEFCRQAAEKTAWELPRPLSLARLSEELRAIAPRPPFEPITADDLDAIRGQR